LLRNGSLESSPSLISAPEKKGDPSNGYRRQKYANIYVARVCKKNAHLGAKASRGRGSEASFAYLMDGGVGRMLRNSE